MDLYKQQHYTKVCKVKVEGIVKQTFHLDSQGALIGAEQVLEWVKG